MAFLPAFLGSEQLRAFVRAGQLELVLWDHMGECKGAPHMRCWQPLVYSHALLEAWGSGTHLLISDIDEYFVLPTGNTSLAGALQGCTGGGKAMARPTREICPCSVLAVPELSLPDPHSAVHAVDCWCLLRQQDRVWR